MTWCLQPWLLRTFGHYDGCFKFLDTTGVCIPAAFLKLLPKWIVGFGLLLALAGELSWLNLVFPQALFLIPLVRFPGFIWLIAAGFALPKTMARVTSSGLGAST